jgi:DNA-binding transcriptional LysR family regulator
MHDRLEWDDVRFFLVSVRAGGFGAAARRLGTQQSTVSRRVAALEARLGGALFDRTAAGTTLTALGRRVLPEAEVIEQALTRVGDAASSTERTVEGVVRLAVSETVASVVVIPRVLPRLLAKHPSLRIDLVVSDTATDLSRREADVAVRFFLPPSGDFLAKRLARMTMAVVGTPEVAKRWRERPLAAWPFVSASMQGFEVAEETWRARQQPQTAPRMTSNSFHSVYEAARAGLGVAVLPTLLANSAGLVALPLPRGVSAPPPLEAWLVTPRALRRVPRIAAVFEALETALLA